ncbi:hypothetical protein O181_045231 [Austropuccinia psidii MF-1]|uniref:Uncharacterized protein n=1 Tax=Austropuccinia psidii MF-1 TaxID=1389203 RepID=A0A9Q3DJU3_9BASI|nr:hypothetical protein [Austropuccinia psidii MF-1]
MTTTCYAFRQAHKKFLFNVGPFWPRSQRSSHPRHPCEDSFVVDDDESVPEWEWTLGPQTGRREKFLTISPVPSSINLSIPPPMVTSLLNWSKVIIQRMNDGDGERTFELGPTITMYCHFWDSNVKESSYFSSLTHFSSFNHTSYFSLHIEQNPLNPPQKDTPVPWMPRKQTPWQPTPGPNGTQWSEDLFRKPSQHDERPIPGPSQPSELHEDALTRKPEPEVAVMKNTEEPFGKSPHQFFHSYPLFLTCEP